MLALDAHPAVRARATGLTSVESRDGLRVVEAESASPTTGRVVTPESAWTGESAYSGGNYLELDAGETATLNLGSTGQRSLVEPVAWQQENGTARSHWRQGSRELGTLRHRVGAQGITAQPGALLPQLLEREVRPAVGSVEVTARLGQVALDALLVRPVVSRMSLSGSAGATELVHSASLRTESVALGTAGRRAQLRAYDARGRLVLNRTITGRAVVDLRAGGVAVVVR